MTKPSNCKACGNEYQRLRPLQVVCSQSCAMSHAREQVKKKAAKEFKAERKESKAKLDAMRTKPQLTRLAQTAFNAFIRTRDAGKPCISCGNPLSSEPNTYDCGHYRSVGSAPHMRFVEENANGQCKHCNRHLAGNHVAYRMGLVNRIGQAAVDMIESDSVLRKYSHDGLIEIARHYRSEARRIAAIHPTNKTTTTE